MITNHDRPIRRPFAVRMHASMLAAALCAFAAVAPASAQFGGRASFGEAFQPDILQRDVNLMNSTLGLEEWQRPVVEALLQDYMTGFTTGVEALKERMKNASQEAAKSNPSNGDAILEKVMQPINAWRDEKRRMRDKFMSDLQSQLGPQQMERWPSFERAMRRERMLPGGDLSGESTDLFAVMAKMQLSPAEQEAAKQAVTDYEVALDQALAARTAGMLRLEPELAEAMRSMSYERGADAQDKIMTLRIAVRSANDQGIETIAAALGARGAEFRAQAAEASFPDVYRPHPVMILMQQARALESLTPEQATQVDALMGEFRTACDAENTKLCAAIRDEEPKTPRKRTKAMMDRQAGTPAPQATSATDPVVKARAERERMGDPFRDRLVAILTEEQRAQLPGLGGAPKPAAPKRREGGDTDAHREDAPEGGGSASPQEVPDSGAAKPANAIKTPEKRGSGRRPARAPDGDTAPGPGTPGAGAAPKADPNDPFGSSKGPR